jgi:hypothetical protein
VITFCHICTKEAIVLLVNMFSVLYLCVAVFCHIMQEAILLLFILFAVICHILCCKLSFLQINICLLFGSIRTHMYRSWTVGFVVGAYNGTLQNGTLQKSSYMTVH